MAQWEVTIRGNILIEDEEGDENQFLEQYTFIWTGPDLITTMMSIQTKLDVLNDKQTKKWETTAQEYTSRKARFLEEFQIVGIVETDHIRFGDKWIDEYIETGVISQNYDEQEEV